jgi:hypothetical protein
VDLVDVELTTLEETTVFLSKYDFDGDPEELLLAYDRLMAGVDDDDILLHACITRSGGITVYDCCPSEEVFRSFSSSADFASAVEAAGLPAPTAHPLGNVHLARVADGVVRADPA